MFYNFTNFDKALRTLITLLGMLETFTYIAYQSALSQYKANKNDQTFSGLKSSIDILHDEISNNYNPDDDDNDERKKAYSAYFREYKNIPGNNEDNDNQDGMNVDMGQEGDDSSTSTGESLPPKNDDKNVTTMHRNDKRALALLKYI